MGGLVNGVASSTVSVFDCRSHSWHQAPNMLVAREQPEAMAIDGKIYVRGLKDLVQVFDPKTQAWSYESTEWKSLDDYYGVLLNGFYGMARHTSSCCVIDSVLYFYYKGELKWYDKKVRVWRILKGLGFKLPKFFFGSNTSSLVHLADYGGKMAVLWDGHDHSSNSKGRNVWCTSEEIWGRVEWSDDSEAVLKVPGPVAFVRVLAATL